MENICESKIAVIQNPQVALIPHLFAAVRSDTHHYFNEIIWLYVIIVAVFNIGGPQINWAERVLPQCSNALGYVTSKKIIQKNI